MYFNPFKKEIYHATWRTALTLAALFMFALPAHAACSNNEDGNPGQNGEIEYFSGSSSLVYCDDTNWINMLDIADTLTNNLLGYWKLDETSGTTSFDSSGNGYNGTMVGGLTGANSISAVIDTGIQITATAQTIDIGDNAFDEMTNYSTCTWFYDSGDGGGYLNLIGKDGGGGSAGWNLYFQATNRVLGFYNTDRRYEETASGIYNYNEWNHFCGTTNGGTSGDSIQLYLNGSLVTGTEACISACPNQDDSAFDVQIGPQTNIDMAYDDVRIYDRVLTAGEITTLYNLQRDDGLVGHWKLDETSGIVANDSTQFDSDGTMQNGLTGANTVTGRINSALDMDGVDDHISLTRAPELLFETNFSMTSSAWVKIPKDQDCSGNKVVVGHRETGARQWWMGCETGTNAVHLEFDATEELEISGSTALNTGRWVHITGTYDTTTNIGTVYVDGVADGTGTLNFTDNINGANPLCIGSYGVVCEGYNFNGFIDDVRMYDRALSTDEVYVLAHCTNPGTHFYNYNQDVAQWCDGVNSPVNMGVPASGSGGCAGGVEGSFRYNTDRYEYCDGAGWVDIGK